MFVSAWKPPSPRQPTWIDPRQAKMKLGGAMIPPDGVAAAYSSSVHSGLSSPMPSQNRRIAMRVRELVVDRHARCAARCR